MTPKSYREAAFELSCRFWNFLDRTCETVTRGRHFYGPLRFDPVLRIDARMCRFCRTSLIPAPTKETKR